MTKIKGMLTIGVILLFLGVIFNPVTAQLTVQDKVQEKMEAMNIGAVQQLQLTRDEIVSMQKFLPELIEKISKATSRTNLVDIVQSFIAENGRHPVLVFLLNLVIKGIDFNYKISQLRPLRKNVLILSWGFTNKFLSLGKNKFNLMRPFTFWFYSGRSNLVLNSRTIIIDPYPFGIKMLTGRQAGLMSDFKGLYIHRSGSIADKAITMFFGFSSVVRGFDLSPMK
ncbi:MAG TPA: hypothetical protein HA258_00670 [Thermoplasmata archaeon]|jgi:hypothetical protein|nr:hypothetical protein [Thermoplasmata archaeon]